MRTLLCLLIPCVLAAGPVDDNSSMLKEAWELGKVYIPLIAKLPPPSDQPQTDALLRKTSAWLSIDLSKMAPGTTSVLASLEGNDFWEMVRDIGFDAAELWGLKGPANTRVNFQIDPKFGTKEEYAVLVQNANEHGIRMIGSVLGDATGWGPDFDLALQNVSSYQGLYSLIEIPQSDWNLLPEVINHQKTVNVPWLMLQALQQKGYAPSAIEAYVKETAWNATGPVLGRDGKTRRWIYLRDANGSPRFNWLQPSLASERVLIADALYSSFQLGQPILQLDRELPLVARESLSLFVRKWNGFTAAFGKNGLESFTEQSADLFYDPITPTLVLHALKTQDAEILRLMNRLLLEKKVQPKKLVHFMGPFTSCDWKELLSPGKKYHYNEEELTGEALRTRLVKANENFLNGYPSSFSWIQECNSCVLNRKEQLDGVLKLHLLLAKFFAWQPGVFQISANELIGSIDKFNLMEPIDEALYATLPTQLTNQKSFVSALKRILRVRRDISLERADLVKVEDADNKSVVLLTYKLPETGSLTLLAANFSKQTAIQTIESPTFVRTNAIDLYSGLSLEKKFESSSFTLNLEPYSAQLILFHPRSYTPK